MQIAPTILLLSTDPVNRAWRQQMTTLAMVNSSRVPSCNSRMSYFSKKITLLSMTMNRIEMPAREAKRRRPRSSDHTATRTTPIIATPISRVSR